MEIESQAPRIEELLGHLGWVRALAGRLVADAASADDLVQQTWLAALERPPRHGSNPRGWLARVLKNQLRQGARATRRRGERPFSSTSADAAPEFRDDATPVQLAEEADEQRRLVGLVKALEEPFRSTLLLRYARGWNSARIANHQGVPSGTVRWRLSQGLAQLRDRLDSTHAGDRRAWALAFIPWAQAPTGKSAGLAVVWLAAVPGWITMKLVSNLAAAAVIALVAWNSIELGDVRPAEAPLNSPQREESALVAPEDSHPAAGNPAERSSVPTVAAATVEASELRGQDRPLTSVVSLRFVDENGSPVQGVEVLDEFGEALDGRSAGPESAEDGRVELDLRTTSGVVSTDSRDSAAKIVTCTWIAQHREHRRKTFSVTAPLGTDFEAGDIVLLPGANLVGRLVDERGVAVVEGWVEVEELHGTGGYDERTVLQRSMAGPQGVEVRTDDEGRFKYWGSPTGGIRLWAGHRGLVAEVRDLVGLEAGEVRDLGTLVLADQDSRYQVRGIVLDPDGRAAPNVRVLGTYTTDSGPRSDSTWTDSRGRFQFESLHGSPWDLVTSPTSRAPFAGRQDAVPTGTTDVEIHCTPSRLLRIEVVDAEGEPITNETVDVEIVDAIHGTSVADVWLSGHEAGTWIAPVPSVAFMVKAESSQHSEETQGPFQPAGVRGDLRIELQSAPGIRGKIALEEGATIQGRLDVYRVADHDTFVRGFPSRLEMSRMGKGRIQKDGSFVVSHREAGEFALFALCEGFAPLEVRVQVVDPRLGADLGLLHLGPGGTLEGHLLLDEGENTARRVIAISRGDSQPRDTITDDEGRFQFDGLTPGSWQVELRSVRLEESQHLGSTGSSPPYRRTPSVCEVHGGRTTRYDVDLRSHSRNAICTVTGSLAAPKESGLWLAALTDLGPSPSSAVPTPRVELDGAGRFQLTSNHPGPHRLTLTRAVDPPAEGELPLVLYRDFDLERGITNVQLEVAFGSVQAEGVFGSGTPGVFAIGDLGEDWWSIVPLTVEGDAFGGETAIGRAVPSGQYGIALMEDMNGASRAEDLPTRAQFEVREGRTTRVVVP